MVRYYELRQLPRFVAGRETIFDLASGNEVHGTHHAPPVM